MSNEPNTPPPRIYVACLASYNAGHLHGAWIDVTTPDDMLPKVAAMLRASPALGAEEWAIHDHRGFEGASLSEYASPETVCELADFITTRGPLGAKVLSYFDDSLKEARKAFEEHYAGQYHSAGDFAEEVYEETGGGIPESLRYYIDWKAYARDMTMNGEILVFQVEFDAVHVFWSR